jgi:probable rRNA maturation factor
MTVPGDISPSQSAVEPAPPDPEPSPRLELTILTEAGDWSGFAEGEAAIRAAADALARHPRCADILGSGLGAQACVVLGDNTMVQSLNRDYRGKDAPTNVLSFPFQAPPGAGDNLDDDDRGDGDMAAEGGMDAPEPRELGDVVLAVETLAREAGEQGIAPVHHLQHLVVHGLLHLMGFDHETDAQAEVMEGLEVEILTALGIANPYAPLSNAGEV